ncbi:granulocyte-macrophage colony-stimulating factor receptor subunit alpha [Pteropus alecto]|uniref:granulocyte-macrophage colony-stimulating factor receptor subunit alpha n=1 Tax=Pteropus alecto TaxID=9402 RepID=UPI000D538E10|nr:granulocyte-macrophage colony-stimulating factor receptor subunit alpha [Pteropus alecto]
MNCSWTKGPAAPDDVQYFLYVQDSKKQWGRECPHYVRESGTHVGCHVPDVSSWASQAYFLVNGTSRHAKIQFFDSFLWLKTIERCNPPGNISVLCNATHCRILWEKPRTRRRLSDRDFQYQLQVQQEVRMRVRRAGRRAPRTQGPGHRSGLRGCTAGLRVGAVPERRTPTRRQQTHGRRAQRPDDVERAKSQLIELPGDLGNKYHLLSPQPRAAHTLRIRAADTRVLQWSAWSQPVTFGSQESRGRFVYVYVLVVLGTVVCVLAVSCLIQR